MKQINLLEILKDAPDGLAMYSIAHGVVRVYKRGIECESTFRLEQNLPFGDTVGYLDKYGKLNGSGECLLTPNYVLRKWEDGWQNSLMRQEKCIGCVVCQDDYFYEIIGDKRLRTCDGHEKIVLSFKGFRFATKEETTEFLRKADRSRMLRMNKNINPGDLVLVRNQYWETEGTVWRLGHFSHYNQDYGLFYTTEMCAMGTGKRYGYRECIPYIDQTKYLLNTRDYVMFFIDLDETPRVTNFTTE